MLFSETEKASIIIHFAESKSIMQTRRRFFREFNKTAPTYKTIMKWFNIFKNNGSLAQKKKRNIGNDNHLHDTIGVYEFVTRSPKSSIRKIASHFNISRSKVH
ncbi:unnamed protein product [Psylliodes chrysocephalus]|uniref:DUF4817 domain-containing protein n=1 Tax=Psylliodes chrysocephalus TaxID=3402493 RepID=A0A9P0G6J6_9CUCU|nr:unnamed protein product [Psylliodes chrysocephala]